MFDIERTRIVETKKQFIFFSYNLHQTNILHFSRNRNKEQTNSINQTTLTQSIFQKVTHNIKQTTYT